MDEALALVDAEGLDALSSRAVAQRLGVTPMALYRHVRDMDDLLGEAVDRLLADLGTPPASKDWRRWLERFASGLRRMLVDHPAALGLFHRQPVTSPAARARFRRAVAVLEDAGFSSQAAMDAYAAVHTFTIGFCGLEAGRNLAPQQSLLDGPDDADAARIRGFVNEDGFLRGLRALIAGLDPGPRSR